MANNTNFFESPQAAAIYKHKLIKSYIPPWAGKVGSTSSGKRVIVYDAYSGPGRYDDNNPGSPELLVDTAVAMAQLRKVRTIFSEKDPRYCQQLSALLREKGVDAETYAVRVGPVDQHVDSVLREAGTLPLFVFLDPFGLTVSFEQIVHILASRDINGYSRLLQPKTELLMNFSYEAVRRIGGVVRSARDYPAKSGQIQALNAALGGEWWQNLASNEPEGWVQKILEEYARRIGKAAGFGYITAGVADSLTASPVYELILFTRHNDGLWEAANAMSHARKAWREWLVERKEAESGGQAELRGLEFADDESAWVTEIADNVSEILIGIQSFTVSDRLDEVLGRTLGLARETHIRKALKVLCAQGDIRNVPTGSLQRAQIARS